MSEAFKLPKIPDAATMREQVYELEKKRLESRIAETENMLSSGEVLEESEVTLLNGTLSMLRKQLNILEAQTEINP